MSDASARARSEPAAECDLAALNDDQLIEQRASLRARLGQLPWHAEERGSLEERYVVLTDEFDRRARAAWQLAIAGLKG